MMKYAVASILLFVSATLAAPQFDCPAVDARTANVTYQIPDDVQCDKYYVCIDGVAEENLCEDGLVFDPHRRSEHKCDLPYLVDCTGREQLQPAQPINNCPRRYGFFNHPEKKACNMILSCVDGEENIFTCPGDLVFECPSQRQFYPDGTEETHPRYPHPLSCERFYICMEGVYPREQSCPEGLGFNPESRICTEPELIPNCEIEVTTESN